MGMHMMAKRWRRWGAAFVVAVVVPFAAVPTVEATEITRVTSPGGIEAWLVQEPSIPMLALEMVFRGGAALDPEGKEGLAYMLSGLLDEGAGELDSLAFQRRLEELAIGLSFDADRDIFQASLKTLTKNRDEAFRLLGLALSAPRFDEEPVERIRRQIRTGLIRDSEDPDRIANRTWIEAAFPDHPYGRPVRGTLETIDAVGADDLRAFVAERFARDNLIIGAVGDITPGELGRLLDRTLAGIAAEAKPYEVPEVAPRPGRGTTVVRKSIPQSVVVFGRAGVKRDDPDYYAAYVTNYILGGGGFNSRLMEEVREKRGLAYSVYSYLYPLDHAALLLGGVATANGRVADSVRIIREELARMADEGVAADELAEAKTYLNGSFPLRLSSNSRIADMLVAIQVNDLGIDYIDRRPDLINAVTMADVRRVAARLMRTDDLITVVVGDPAGIEGGG
jgi:zinc protease